MDGNQEFTPQLEGEQLKGDSKSRSDPEVVNLPKTSLLSKISKTRALAQANLQRINFLLGSETSETGQVTDIDARSLLKELAKGESISPNEYLQRSHHALSGSARLKEQINTERDALEGSMRQKDNRWHIEQRLEALEEARGLRKITAAFERRRLTKQKTGIQREIDAIRSQVQTKIDQRIQLQEQETPIRKRQKELLLVEISQAVQSVKSGYEQLLQDIIEDDTIPGEIRESYIQSVIAPQVKTAMKDRKLPEIKKKEFYQALKDYVDHRSDPEEERQPFKDKLDSFLTYEGGFSKVREDCQTLERGGDKQMVQQLVATMAAEDIAPIRDAVEPHFSEWESSRRFSDVFTRAIEPVGLLDWNRDANSFGNKIISALSKSDEESYPYMRFWQAVKDSPSSHQVFGEIIKRQDQEYYQRALDKSILDTAGGHIDILQYYPRPEAIRNLVILAAADYSNYRTVHANCVLSDLARRDNWGEILDQAQQVYPALKTARPFLENWRYREQSNNPGVQEAIKDFVTSVLADEQVDKRLASLAMQSLPNSALLEGLHQRGVIPDVEIVTALKDTEAFFDKLENDRQEAYRNNIKTDLPYISGLFLKMAVRKNLFSLMNARRDEVQTYLDTTKRLSILSQRITKNKTDYVVLDYLSDNNIIQKLAETSLTSENVTILLSAYKDCPALLKNSGLRSEFCNQFSGQETVRFFNDVSGAFGDKQKQLLQVVKLVGTNSLDRVRALELPIKAGDILTSPSFSLAIDYPTFYLTTDTDTEFFRKMTNAYQSDNDVLGQISRVMKEGKISRELALAFPQQASALMNDKMREIRFLVFNNADLILKDSTDLKFLNKVAGEFGKKSDIILRGYLECLRAGVIITAEKDLVLEFGKQFRVISSTTLNGYKEAKVGGYEKVYIAQLTALAEKMTGQAIIMDKEKAKPFYKDLLRHVYSNNSGQWGSFDSNDSCGDRSSDIAEFKVKPRYEINLLSQSKIRVKAGESLNPRVQEEVQAPIFAVSGKMSEAGFNYEKIKTDLNEEIGKRLKQVVENGGLSGLSLDVINSPEERLFLILSDSIYGTKTIDSQAVKNLLITYEFANFEDINDYIAGTQDRVGRASNQDYALLCEVGAFYSDRIKEVNRRLVESAWNNPAIAKLMPEYFKKLAQETVSTERHDKINRLQVDRLGLSDSFVRQVGKILEKRKGRKYEPDEIRKVISRYEGITGGLTEKSSTSENPQTRSFYGQLRSQREKTMDAVRLITGEEVDAAKVHLGEVNLQQVLDVEENMREGKYDEEQFASYTVQRFIDLFDSERTKIDGELDKFESISGKQREVLYGYITKTKETAYARMVGGVCVAGDNPDKHQGKNMWEMPNYFQLVLQEPDTLQCQGLVLLHHFIQGNKKVLTASINPSSTYLYSVDEGALFNGIMGSLEDFATENGFDMITLSHTNAIRTNRTGGEFENALKNRVSRVGKTFRFDSPQQFSFRPNYQLQDMDVVWEQVVVS